MAKGRKKKYSDDTIRLPIRFDSELQLDLMKDAASKLHWSLNRLIVQASFEVAKSILAAARAEEDRENGQEVASKQPTAIQSNRC